jgi:hypothetical protein
MAVTVVTPVTAVTEHNGVVVTLTLDRNVVAPGGKVLAVARVENRTDRAVQYSGGGCGLSGDVGVELSPAPGREWHGRAALFKAIVMRTARLPVAAFAAPQVTDKPQACVADTFIAALAAHQSVDIPGLWWDAEYAPGVPARPGIANVTMNFPVTTGSVLATANLRIAGPDDHAPSPGEVVDAALADARFAAWLDRAAPSDRSCFFVGWYLGMWHVDPCGTALKPHAPVVDVDARTGRVVAVRNVPN